MGTTIGRRGSEIPHLDKESHFEGEQSMLTLFLTARALVLVDWHARIVMLTRSPQISMFKHERN
jgi:hypothetical protein